jgi:type 1 glutamine amidotransferase
MILTRRTLPPGIFRAARAALVAAGMGTASLAGQAPAQPVKVLFWGGPGGGAHNVPAFRDSIVPYLAANGMTVQYRQDPPFSWIHPDSLGTYDVLLAYTTDQNASDLSTAQINTLKNWLASGRVMVALHGTTNTFINGNATVAAAWRSLTGAQFVDHGPAGGNAGNSGRVAFAQPAHASLQGADTLPASAANSGGLPYWDEGRQHNAFASDTIVIARSYYASPATNIPWIWVRPQGDGWVYYNASGHDGQVWTRPEFKGQVRRALQWGYEVKQSFTGLRGRIAANPFLSVRDGRLIVPFRAEHSFEVLDLAGRRLLFEGPSSAERHDVSALPAGTYGVRLRPERGDALRALLRIE